MEAQLSPLQMATTTLAKGLVVAQNSRRLVPGRVAPRKHARKPLRHESSETTCDVHCDAVDIVRHRGASVGVERRSLSRIRQNTHETLMSAKIIGQCSEVKIAESRPSEAEIRLHITDPRRRNCCSESSARIPVRAWMSVHYGHIHLVAAFPLPFFTVNPYPRYETTAVWVAIPLPDISTKRSGNRLKGRGISFCRQTR
jgi:hypothetical protein